MKKLLLLFFATALFFSCKKYDEGGLIGKTEKRIEGNWKIDKYLRDGVDETDQLIITNYLEIYNPDDNSYFRSYNDKNGDPQEETGTFTHDADKKIFSINGVGSLELTDQTSTVSSSEYNILRLKKDEYWYSFENGGETHEFRMVSAD